MYSIFDAGITEAHTEMYQAWAAPDLKPGQPQPRVSNWHPEDRIVYCGGDFAKAAYSGTN